MVQYGEAVKWPWAQGKETQEACLEGKLEPAREREGPNLWFSHSAIFEWHLFIDL